MTLYEAELAPDRLDALVEDIAACTRLLEVRVKGDAAAHSSRSPSLEEAIDALRGRRVRAIQIVYEHAGGTWCDTLVARGATVRLVRSAAP